MMSHCGCNSWFLFWLWPHKWKYQLDKQVERDSVATLLLLTGRYHIHWARKKGDRFRLWRSRIHIPGAPRRTTRRPLVVSGHATEGSWLVKRDWPEQLRFFFYRINVNVIFNNTQQCENVHGNDGDAALFPCAVQMDGHFVRKNEKIQYSRPKQSPVYRLIPLRSDRNVNTTAGCECTTASRDPRTAEGCWGRLARR